MSINLTKIIENSDEYPSSSNCWLIRDHGEYAILLSDELMEKLMPEVMKEANNKFEGRGNAFPLKVEIEEGKLEIKECNIIASQLW